LSKEPTDNKTMKNTILTATKEQKNSARDQQEIIEFLKKKLNHVELIENDVQDYYYCNFFIDDDKFEFELTFDEKVVEILYHSKITNDINEYSRCLTTHFIKLFDETYEELVESILVNDFVCHNEIRELYRDINIKTKKLKSLMS